jgi:hypothetical protein
MSKATKLRILIWGISLGVAAILLIISNATYENPNKTTIFVKAPETMVGAFERAFDKLKLDKDYIIEAVTDEKMANFVVREGINKEGDLIAYSPFVAVLNSLEEHYNELSEEEILVKSATDGDYNDLDFLKVINMAIEGKDCRFKIYYPSKDSDSWEEFYNFMLLTVNDGYYPTEATELEESKSKVEKFLSTKYAEPFNNNTLQRSNGIPKDSIYIMAYSDLVRVYKQTGGFNCRIIYPMTTVYHSYYATYDELGKIIYDCLGTPLETFSISTKGIGYNYLREYGYNTRNSMYVYAVGTGSRKFFNAVEIPGEEVLKDIEEAKSYE